MVPPRCNSYSLVGFLISSYIAPIHPSSIPKAPSRPWIVLDLTPTGVLIEERRQRRLARRRRRTQDKEQQQQQSSSSSLPDHWFNHSAIYATIPDPADVDYLQDEDVQDFHRFRHLSRYEVLWRWQNQLDWEFSEEHNTVNGTDAEEEVDESQTWNDFTIRTVDSSTKRQQNTWHRWLSRRFLSSIPTVKGGQYNNFQSVPLSQGYGTHFANLWIGTPQAQRKTLIVDTGSHYTALPCVGCADCGARHHTDPYFDPSKSATFRTLHCDECHEGVPCDHGVCRFQQAYTEGSTWEAIQVKDRVYFGGSDVLDAVDPADEKYAIDFMFGCQTSMTGLFITQLADGIIGMSAHTATLPKQLYDYGKIEHNLFALCFRRELGTSKRGVHAGSMSLGGVPTSLDSSPIVYARNVAKYGWYTVYVKNIYIRSGGGQSAKDISNSTSRIVRVRMDSAALNSGKGVIVDSGTTDTYLNKQIAKEFSRAWKQITGTGYSQSAITLTDEELRQMPTILIQCQAASHKKDPSVEDYDAIAGYTGSLDPTSPEDLLIAIPATSYMDYSTITGRYMSRIYFTESVGAVLGSNTMQGHNVVFDWENGRVGFAESSCAYDKKDIPKAAMNEVYPTDCQLTDPVLSQQCASTVAQELCRHNPKNIALLGTEKLTSIVESPGTDGGLSCVEAGKALSGTDPHDHSVISCNGEGVCEEERPCQLTCSELSTALDVAALPDWKQSRYKCGESPWSACDYQCKQTRIESLAFSDGLCHEVQRYSRACHIGACARLDACRVPFIVHASLGIKGGLLSKWNVESEEIFRLAFVSAAQELLQRVLFEAGDIHVVSALPWSDDNGSLADKSKQKPINLLGIRVVVEISIYNDFFETQFEEEDDGAEMSATEGNRKLEDQNKTEAGSNDDVGCGPDTLFPLAKVALEIKNALLDDSFLRLFVEEVKAQLQSPAESPFYVFFHDEFDPQNDTTIMAWTVRTEVDDTINYFGPQRPIMVLFYILLHAGTVLSTLFLGLLTSWSLFWTMYDFFQCQGFFHFSRLDYSYRSVATTDDDIGTVEDMAIRGTGVDDESSMRHFLDRYRFANLKQRLRGPINDSRG